MTHTKNKRNKLNIRDRVQMKQKCLQWYAEHASTIYTQLSGGTINPDDFPAVAGILDAAITKKLPTGKVIGYGANDDKEISFVKIEFKLKYGKLTAYFSESDVRKLK